MTDAPLCDECRQPIPYAQVVIARWGRNTYDEDCYWDIVNPRNHARLLAANATQQHTEDTPCAAP